MAAERGGARADDAGAEDGSSEPVRSGRGVGQRRLPLNSRRLTAQTLRQLAEGLGSPERCVTRRPVVYDREETVIGGP